jgi:protein-S-isoprenylcysteine O-methyltransferase Ste14
MKVIVDFIYRIATGRMRLRMLLAPVFAAFFLRILGMVILLSLTADALFNLPRPLQPPWDEVVALPLLAAGVLLWLWSAYHFAKAKGTPVPVNPPAKLVDTGPYAYVRNPMLSGVFLTLFAVALLIGSPSLLYVFTPIFIGLSILGFKLIEEPELEKRLGKSYLDYKGRTPLLIPRRLR